MPTLPLDQHGRFTLPSNSTLPPPSGTGAGNNAQHRGLAAAGWTEQYNAHRAKCREACWFQRAGSVGKRLAAALDTHRGAMSR
jgi:hypothetical protein